MRMKRAFATTFYAAGQRRLYRTRSPVQKRYYLRRKLGVFRAKFSKNNPNLGSPVWAARSLPQPASQVVLEINL
jgi:hypothetical protein